MATIPEPPPRHGGQLDGPPPRATRELNGALPRATTLDNDNGNDNGRAALDPAAAAKSGSDKRQSKGGIEGQSVSVSPPLPNTPSMAPTRD